MPHKSRRQRARHPAPGPRKQEAPITQAGITPNATAPAASTPVEPASLPRKTAHKAAAARNLYPYVITELRRIGILAGIMIVILIILALFLP